MKQAAAELERLGVSPEIMGTWAEDDTPPPEDDSTLILPLDHREAVRAFTGAATQWDWITPGMGRPLPRGLNYPGLEASLRMAGIVCTPALFEDLRLMEAAALPVLAADPA